MADLLVDTDIFIDHLRGAGAAQPWPTPTPLLGGHPGGTVRRKHRHRVASAIARTIPRGSGRPGGRRTCRACRPRVRTAATRRAHWCDRSSGASSSGPATPRTSSTCEAYASDLCAESVGVTSRRVSPNAGTATPFGTSGWRVVIDLYCCFCQTDTCDAQSLVNGDRCQSAHLLARSRPASLAIRSSSEGHTNRNGVRTSWTPVPSSTKW